MAYRGLNSKHEIRNPKQTQNTQCSNVSNRRSLATPWGRFRQSQNTHSMPSNPSTSKFEDSSDGATQAVVVGRFEWERLNNIGIDI